MGTAAPEASARTKTSYAVLQQQTITTDEGSSVVWSDLTTVDGVSRDDAIKAAINEKELEAGTFVAIPARSFEPRTIAVQTRRSVSIS